MNSFGMIMLKQKKAQVSSKREYRITHSGANRNDHDLAHGMMLTQALCPSVAKVSLPFKNSYRTKCVYKSMLFSSSSAGRLQQSKESSDIF